MQENVEDVKGMAIKSLGKFGGTRNHNEDRLLTIGQVADNHAVRITLKKRKNIQTEKTRKVELAK